MLHLSTVEPDTLKLAQEIFKVPFVSERFALAGGTSLALQIGHRSSIDLDLFSPSPFYRRQYSFKTFSSSSDKRKVSMMLKLYYKGNTYSSSRTESDGKF